MNDRRIVSIVTIGLMLRRSFRVYLDSLRIDGHPVEYTENRRFLDSIFTIAAPEYV